MRNGRTTLTLEIIMLYLTINHNFLYEPENILRLFYPFEKITVQDTAENLPEDTRIAKTVRERGERETLLTVRMTADGQTVERQERVLNDDVQYEDTCELYFCRMIFAALSEITGYRPAWGVLTGVRPAKLMRRLSAQTGEDAAGDYFRERLLVEPEKIALCRMVGGREEEIVARSSPNSFSLYIAIPFCPSRCSYCSFVSHSVEKSAALVPEYVRLLCEELKDTAKIAAGLGLRLETVYIGGGTPTTLSPEQLRQIMETVGEFFDLSRLREYTVEAGRPDTITTDKLSVLKSCGATRVSINPQTMNDAVLREIGRNHTARQVKTAFQMARECGFDNINMDLIAGLPTDTVESFRHTMDEILQLNPESVTIHTLAMKRASRLTTSGETSLVKSYEAVMQMLEIGQNRLCKAGILPYYMYRQSKTVGNLENVGYAKPGFEGLYNVYIMDETHTILACGASAVTKLRDPFSSQIERVFNYKYPYEYNRRFDEILTRKLQVNRFYEQLRNENKYSWGD